MARFASIVLVDGRGWLLLQERDEHAVIAPGKWGFTGGHLEPGEDYLGAAVRELREETGLVVPADRLRLFGVFPFHHEETGSDDEVALFAARTTATDDEVVVGEGRQIVFVGPDEARGLDLTASAAEVLRDFLDSDLYQELTR